MTHVLLDGNPVSPSAISPQRHRFVSMWRAPFQHEQESVQQGSRPNAESGHGPVSTYAKVRPIWGEFIDENGYCNSCGKYAHEPKKAVVLMRGSLSYREHWLAGCFDVAMYETIAGASSLDVPSETA